MAFPSPDDKKFAILQFGTGCQSLEKDIDTEDENQHHENNSNRQMVPREIGAFDSEIVIRRGEALAYHRRHTNEDAPRRDTVIDRTGRLRKVL